MTLETVDWVAVGRRLRLIRTSLRLSQREIGQRFGVSQNMISLYEKGRSRAPLDFYVQMAHFGDRTLDWLFCGREDRTAKTLHEMRDLHDSMNQSLTAVRHLLDREVIRSADERLMGVDGSEALRRACLDDPSTPPCLQALVRDPYKWEELRLTGREVCALRVLVRLLGDFEERALYAILAITRNNRQPWSR